MWKESKDDNFKPFSQIKMIAFVRIRLFLSHSVHKFNEYNSLRAVF